MNTLKLSELQAVMGGFLPAGAAIVEALSVGSALYIGTAKLIKAVNDFAEIRSELTNATLVFNQFGAKLGENIFTLTHPNLGK